MTEDYQPDVQALYIPSTDGANALADAPVYFEVSDTESPRRTSRLPDAVDCFVGDQAKVSSAACVQAIVSAISNTNTIPACDNDIPRPGLAENKPVGQWYRGRTKEGHTMPTYTDNRGGKTTIQIKGSTEASAWTYARQLGDFDADILLILLAQSGINQREEVGIRAEQILMYRGIEKIKRPGGRKASGYRDTDYRPIGAAMERLKDINICIEGQSYYRNGKQTYYSSVAPLILISNTIYQNEVTFNEVGEQSENSYPVFWRYRIGEWIENLLAEDANSKQWAWITQRALHYNPYKELWEKRLARYMVFHLRMNAKNGTGEITRQVGKLLQELHLDVNERYPQKTEDHFKKTMNTLKQHGIIDDWHWAKDNAKKPARRWINTWLEWNVVVGVASQIATLYGDIAIHRQDHADKVIALSAKKRSKIQ